MAVVDGWTREAMTPTLTSPSQPLPISLPHLPPQEFLATKYRGRAGPESRPEVHLQTVDTKWDTAQESTGLLPGGKA